MLLLRDGLVARCRGGPAAGRPRCPAAGPDDQERPLARRRGASARRRDGGTGRRCAVALQLGRAVRAARGQAGLAGGAVRRVSRGGDDRRAPAGSRTRATPVYEESAGEDATSIDASSAETGGMGERRPRRGRRMSEHSEHTEPGDAPGTQHKIVVPTSIPMVSLLGSADEILRAVEQAVPPRTSTCAATRSRSPGDRPTWRSPSGSSTSWSP